MKTGMANRLSYIGSGIGLALFVVSGLLPGSFIGGVLGLKVTGVLFGLPVEPTVVSRAILAVSMLVGVLVTGVVFVMAGAVCGWLLGVVVDAIARPKKAGNPIKA